MTTNNTASLIALLDAIAPTVEDIAGEGHFPERDRHALDDLNYHIRKAQHLAGQPRVRRLLDAWSGKRLVRPRQRPELDEAQPKPVDPAAPGVGMRRVADHLRRNPGATIGEMTAAFGVSRRSVEIYVHGARRAGLVHSRSSTRPARYFVVTEGDPA